MPSAFLADRGVIKVTGEDARSFLNGLVTSDMDKVAVDRARYAALLTPQGKILFDFIVAEADGEQGGGFYLDAPLALAADLAKRLGFYKLRAKVIVENISDTAGVVAVWAEDRATEASGIVYADPRHPALGDRIIASRTDCEALGPEPAESYHAHRIALGVPEGGKDFAFGDAFPHEADMDQLGGVDFDKGCYVGQEVVSRMEHRGTARTRIVPIVFRDGVSPPEGTEVMADGKVSGRTGSFAPGGRSLAMVRLDRIEDALTGGGRLEAGGLAFDLDRPDFIRFAFPGDAVKSGS